MLSTFVIGLREGLEAALIVGIVAAFLRQRGRLDLLRLVWIGVGLAAAICLVVGIGLHVVSADLPQKQQEGLETVVGAIAVTMVTYMVVWMRRHSRELKRQLEGAASSALESGSGMALVAMAFLAVFREGFETAVFLLAAFNEAANPVTATAGAVLGLVVAVVLGYGIYRGGVSINLSKFFRFTGGVLVLVAAGLVVNALHTAHEAGWLNSGQGPTFSLAWLVRPGSVQSSLITGMLGWQPHPVVIELVGWLLYLIPVGLYVVWPPGRAVPRRVVVRTSAVVAVGAVLAGGLLTLLAPGAEAAPRTQTLALTATGTATGTSPVTVHTVVSDARRLVVTTSGAVARTWTLTPAGSRVIDGRRADVFTVADVALASPRGLPATATLTQLAALGGGRLPLGVSAALDTKPVPLHYDTRATLRVALDATSRRILDLTLARATSVDATTTVGVTRVGSIRAAAYAPSAAATGAAVSAARAQDSRLDRRSAMRELAAALGVVAVLAVGVLIVAGRRRRVAAAATPVPPSVAGPSVVAPTEPPAGATAISMPAPLH